MNSPFIRRITLRNYNETSVEIMKRGELESINFLQAVTGQPGTSSFSPGSIFAVDNVDGVTQIAGIDPACRQMLRDKLFTPGELLRQNQIALDPAQLTEVRNETRIILA
ncbi:MAG: hypothetical protein NTW21_18375 [Verrucomicrobia bacterium]|nr:hypothetical protein [Verrucomicrobiota bacterium]